MDIHLSLRGRLIAVTILSVAVALGVAVVIRKNFITPLDTLLPTCENSWRHSPVLQDVS